MAIRLDHKLRLANIRPLGHRRSRRLVWRRRLGSFWPRRPTTRLGTMGSFVYRRLDRRTMDELVGW